MVILKITNRNSQNNAQDLFNSLVHFSLLSSFSNVWKFYVNIQPFKIMYKRPLLKFVQNFKKSTVQISIFFKHDFRVKFDFFKISCYNSKHTQKTTETTNEKRAEISIISAQVKGRSL